MVGPGFILVLMTIGQQAMAEIKPLQPLPQDLQKYFDICLQTGDLTYNTGQLVFWVSVQQYVSKFTESQPQMSPREAEYLSKTVYEIMEPFIGNKTYRSKRQAMTRTRREIRAMSLTERRNYFNALNAAKNDRRLTPNVYDVLARFHTGRNIGRAHFGPAFPSWHRIYLYIVETVLRQWYDSTVTIPYWASPLDNEMADSTQSVIWSDGFFGNGNGIVNRGPFSNWPLITPGNTIRRNIGNGNLFSYTGIENILRRVRNADILLPTALPFSNFELQHGGPHVYVGGNMNNLQRAASDPIFFSHHTFVDQIWDRFRRGQRAAGIDPETDYPFDPNDRRFDQAHAPDANAGFSAVGTATLFGMRLSALTQRVGYMNRFSQIIRYEDVPECPDCANSPYLFCEFNRCVSRTITEMAGTFYVQDLGLRSINRPQNNSFTQNSFAAAIGKPPPPPPVHQNEGCPRYTYINDVNTNRMGQNLNNIQPYTSIKQWAYIPVKVVSKRPPSMKKYQAFNLYDDNTPGHAYNEFSSISLQKGYDNCKSDQDAVGKINVVSYGLNHDAYAEDFIIVDNRLGVSEGNGFLPVQKPSRFDDSEVIIAAFDSCGRVCKPYCNLPQCERLNKDYNGGLSISSSMPEQYFRTYEQAILGVWKPSTAYGPSYKNEIVPVTFFCEYGDTWIWDKYDPQPWNPPSVSIRPPHTYQDSVVNSISANNNVHNYNQRHYKDQSQHKPLYQEQKTTSSHDRRLSDAAIQTRVHNVNNDRSKLCRVSSDCVINTPCRGCADFDFEMCNEGSKIAICLNGQYSVTATTISHRKHFYQ